MSKIVCRLSLFVGLAFLSGCSNAPSDSQALENQRYRDMKNLTEAPKAIQEAARAVVKVSANGTNGTGFFISPDGILVTNNHVLGISDSPCPLEGCNITLSIDYERGKPYDGAKRVFVTPIGVILEGDISLFQVWENHTEKRKFRAPHYLEVEPTYAKQLLHQQLHVVGHPWGHLKKWIVGSVRATKGEIFSTTHNNLPGASGSPFLNDAGKVVGILHSGDTEAHNLTSNGGLFETDGTSSAYLKAQWDRDPRKNRFVSLNQLKSVAEVADFADALYLAEKNSVVLNLPAVGQQTVTVLEALGQACDVGLNPASRPLRTKFNRAELEKILAPCRDSWDWIDCRNPAENRGFKTCPAAADKTKWLARYQKGFEQLHAFHSNNDIAWYTSAWRFEESFESAQKKSKERFLDYLTRFTPEMDFEIAWYLLDSFHHEDNGYRNANYQNVNGATFLRNYRKVPHFGYRINWVVDAALEFPYLSESELNRLLTDLYEDKINVRIGDRLRIESALYERGWIR